MRFSNTSYHMLFFFPDVSGSTENVSRQASLKKSESRQSVDDANLQRAKLDVRQQSVRFWFSLSIRISMQLIVRKKLTSNSLAE